MFRKLTKEEEEACRSGMEYPHYGESLHEYIERLSTKYRWRTTHPRVYAIAEEKFRDDWRNKDND